ncbi:OmpA family protein [Blastococcus sp. SYSU DS0973]
MTPPELAGAAASAVDMAVTQESYYSVVVADGAPYVAASGVLEVTGETVSAQEDQRAANRERIETATANAKARTPETDLLAALRVAADSIADQPGHHTIVVLDSGLSTTGALAFTQPDMLDAVPEEVADTLGDVQQLPALTGTSVIFAGLGDTAAPQVPLHRTQEARLAAIWAAVASEAGASDVQVQAAAEPAGTSPPADLPAVTPVAVPPGYQCSGNTMTITGGPFIYWPDTPVFVDPGAAEDVLRPVAEQIKDRELEVILFGTAANLGTPEGQKQLSNDQAQAVANVFLRFGVPVEQLAVEGLGTEFPGYQPDRDAQGYLIPAAAAANRSLQLQFSGPVTCD